MAVLAPRALTATVLSYSSVQLDWIDCSTDELGFDVLIGRADGSLQTVNSVDPDTVTYTATGLSGGTTYQAQVRVRTPEGQAYSDIVTFTTTEAPTAPGAPSGVAATLLTANSARITWSNGTGTILGTRLVKTRVRDGFTQINTIVGTQTSFTYSGLAYNTLFSVVVQHYNSVGFGPQSSEVLFSTLADPSIPPIGPAGLTISGITETSAVASWTDRSVNETGFRVQWKVTGQTNFSDVALVPANSTTFTLTALNHSTNYTVRVYAYSQTGGLSTEYAETTFDTLSPRVTVPDAPTDLALEQTGEEELHLTWTDNSNNEQEFVIYRKVAPAAFAELDTVPAGVTEYFDSTVTGGTTYVYHVTARNSAGESDPTDDESLLVSVPLEEDLAPTDLVVTQLTDESVILRWTDNAAQELSYSITQSDAENGTYNEVGSVGPNVTDFVLSGLAADTYWFKIDGVNAGGVFGSSNKVSITLSGDLPSAPTAPELTAVAIALRTIRATVQITDITTTNLLVRYRTTVGPGAWTNFYNDAPTRLIHNIGGLSPDTSYDVQAVASNAGGTGSSSIVAVTTPRETGGNGLNPWRGKRASFTFDYDKDDTDRDVMTAGSTTIIEGFTCTAPDPTDGPFCELYVDGVCIARANPVTGVAKVRGWKIDAGAVVEVRFRGSGVGLGTVEGSFLAL